MKLTKADILMMVVLLFLAGGIYFFLPKVYQVKPQDRVVITLNNSVIKNILFAENNVYHIEEENIYHTIAVKDGKVSMIKSNCPDTICVKQGAISHPNQTIVCLPHKLVVSIEQATGNSVDDEGIDAIVK